jgi:hypothetical protein
MCEMIKSYTILLGNIKSKLPHGKYKRISDTPARKLTIVITNNERKIEAKISHMIFLHPSLNEHFVTGLAIKSVAW